VDCHLAPDGATKKVYVPLLFWFNKSIGSALPLIALQYHELKIFITLANAAEVTGIDATVQPQVQMFADFIYLDAGMFSPHCRLCMQTPPELRS
jgi:hypothetical protein